MEEEEEEKEKEEEEEEEEEGRLSSDPCSRSLPPSLQPKREGGGGRGEGLIGAEERGTLTDPSQRSIERERETGKKRILKKLSEVPFLVSPHVMKDLTSSASPEMMQ